MKVFAQVVVIIAVGALIGIPLYMLAGRARPQAGPWPGNRLIAENHSPAANPERAAAAQPPFILPRRPASRPAVSPPPTQQRRPVDLPPAAPSAPPSPQVKSADPPHPAVRHAERVRPEPERPVESAAPPPAAAPWPPPTDCPCADAATAKEETSRLLDLDRDAARKLLDQIVGCDAHIAMIGGHIFDHKESPYFRQDAVTAMRYFWCAAHAPVQAPGTRSEAIHALKKLRDEVPSNTELERKAKALLLALGESPQ
jgi:hypothetical protein